jgi:DNA-binding MarR family transcriptional regulator
VTGRLLVIARHVVDRRAQILKRLDLSPGEFDVLAALSHMTDRTRSKDGPAGVNAVVLVDAALVTSGAITKRLDRLEKAGLAQRAPDPADRRATLVTLTNKGRRTVDKAIREVMEAESEVLAPLSATERKQLLEPLKRLVAAVDTDPEQTERKKRS